MINERLILIYDFNGFKRQCCWSALVPQKTIQKIVFFRRRKDLIEAKNLVPKNFGHLCFIEPWETSDWNKIWKCVSAETLQEF